MAEDAVELTLELDDRTIEVLDELVRRGGCGADGGLGCKVADRVDIPRAITGCLIPSRPDDLWRGRGDGRRVPTIHYGSYPDRRAEWGQCGKW